MFAATIGSAVEYEDVLIGCKSGEQALGLYESVWRYDKSECAVSQSLLVQRVRLTVKTAAVVVSSARRFVSISQTHPSSHAPVVHQPQLATKLILGHYPFTYGHLQVLEQSAV